MPLTAPRRLDYEEEDPTMPVAEDDGPESTQPLPPRYTPPVRYAPPQVAGLDASQPGGRMDAPDLQTRMATNALRMGQAPTPQGLNRIVQRQALEQTPTLTQGGEGSDGPDLVLRRIALKARAGMPLTPEEQRRLATRQQIEAQPNANPKGSISTLLEGTSLDPAGTYREQDARGVANANNARRDEIERRRMAQTAAKNDVRAYNSAQMAKFTANGQRHYTDPATGRLTEVVDEQGRKMFQPTTWEVGQHPKDGRPMLTKRDQYGQRQFKRPTLTLSTDPNDEYLYADMGDGESVPFIKAEDAARDADVSLAKMGMRHKTRRNQAARLEALRPIKEERELANADYQDAKTELEMLKAEAENPATPADPTAATASLTRMMELETATKPGGALHMRKTMVEFASDISALEARRDTYADQVEERSMLIKSEGLDPATDANLIANQRELDKLTQAVQAKTQQMDKFKAAVARLAQPVAAPAEAPTESPNGGVVAQTAKQFTQGALADGYYGAIQGGLGMVDQTARAAQTRNALGDEYNRLGGTLGELERAQLQSANPRRAAMIDKIKGRMAEMEQSAAPAVAEIQAAPGLRPAAQYVGEAREGVREVHPVDKSFSKSFGGRVVAALGQAVGTLPAYVIPGVGPASSLAQTYQQGFDDAKSSGADDAMAEKAGMANLPLASLDSIGDKFIFGRLLKAAKGKLTVGQFAKELLASATVEGVTEGTQQAMTNAIAKNMLAYDANRKIDDDVIKSALLGAIVGGTVTTAGQGAGMIARRGKPGAEPLSDSPIVAPETPPASPADAARFAVEEAESNRDIQGADPTRTQAQVDAATGVAQAEPPKLASESAKALAPEIAEQANTPPPNKSAVESAQVFAEDAANTRAAATAEQGAQALVDQLQEVTGKPREEILATREGKDVAQWAEELQSELEYQKSPLTVNPDRRIAELKSDLAKANVDWQRHLDRTASEAEREAKIQADKDAAGEKYEMNIADAKARHDALVARRDAIEAQLNEADRLRRSPEGAARLRNDLSSTEGQQDVRKRDFTRSRAEEVKQSLLGNQLAAPEETTFTGDAAKDQATLLDTRVGEQGAQRERARLAKQAERALEVSAGEIPSVELSKQAQELAAAEGEPLPERPVRRKASPSASVSATPSAPTDTAQPNPGSNILPEATPAPVGAEKPLAAAAPVSDPGWRPEYAEDTLSDQSRIARRNGTAGDNPATAIRKMIDEARGVPAPSIEAAPAAKPTRAAIIAELRERGVTQVNGKPLDGPDAANSAELINALGKARRGKLIEDAPAPDLITRLESKKLKREGGRLMSGVDPTEAYKVAHNAAIDLVILGVRARRAVAEVVKLAVARFKAKYPNHTPAELASLEADIQNAIKSSSTVSDKTSGLSIESESKSGGDVNYVVKSGSDEIGQIYTTPNPDGTRTAELAMMRKEKSGHGTKAYKFLNETLSKQGSRLASSPIDEMSPAAIGLWDSLVRDGFAKKTQGNESKYHAYEFNPSRSNFAKSKVPPSLRAVGAKVEDIDYEVRNQNARMQEATAIVAKDGDAKAEAMIADQNADPDTRVGVGGVLGRSIMDKMKTAKPEDIPKLAKDFQRVTKSLQENVATRMGQGISMFNRIYQDLALSAGMEYVKGVEKRAWKKMGGPETTEAIADATTELNKANSEVAIDKAIEKLKKKHSTKPAKAALDALQKKIKTIADLKRIGALTRSDLVEIAGKELGIEQPSPEKLKKISEIGDRIANAKTPAEKAKAEMDLADASEIFKGDGKVDLEAGILTAGIFSGYTTQGANASGGLMQTIMQLATLVPQNLHRPDRLKGLAEGAAHGLPQGLRDAATIMRSGLSTRDFQTTTRSGDMVAGTPQKSQIELADYRRMYPNMNETVAKALNYTRIVPAKYLFRFMRAIDATLYHANKEAYANLMATKLLEGEFKGAELADMVREKLQTKPEHFLSAKKQAESEGFTGVDLGRRVMDIITERRRASDVGATAERRAEQFGKESTFNQEPVGLAGVLYHAMKYAVEETRLAQVPLLKPIAIALRTPTNVFNEIANYTPVGGARAYFGMRGEGAKGAERRTFNREEREQLFLKSVIGTSLFAAAASGMAAGWLDITADGPEDPNKRKQLQDGGWIRSSFKVGDRRVSFKDTPLAIPLSIMGHVSDAIKYQKPKSDMLLGSQFADALATSPRVIFDMSMLTGTAAAMDAAAGNREGARKLEGILGGVPANLVIPYNRLLRQIDQTFDNKTYKTNPVLGAAPFVRRQGEPNMDNQGRPSKYDPLSRFTSEESSDPVDKLIREKSIFIPGVDKDARLNYQIVSPAQQEARVAAGAPKPKIGERPVMSDAEREAFKRISGLRIRARIIAMEPMLRRLPQDKAQAKISEIAQEEREKIKPLIRAGVGVKK